MRFLTLLEVNVQMIRKRVSYLMLGLGIAATGCAKNEDGTVVTPRPVAGLRYVNAVPDTIGMDIRVIDVVGDAPNTIFATFRTSGSPYGVTITGFPMHTAVQAGTRHIRAFLSGVSPTVATVVVLDTTYTFEQNNNYTVYLYGFANPANGTPSVQALVTKDSVPNIANGKFALRVLNLAPNYTGTPAATVPVPGSGVDVRVPLANSATGAGAALISNTAFGQLSAYITSLDTSSIVAAAPNFAPYRMYVTANGTTGPAIFQASLPLGARGNATTQPVPGTLDSGTAITAVIVPRSTPATGAPQTTPSAVSANIDSIVRSNDTVTVWRRITPGNGTTTCNAAVAAGVATSDIVTISGLIQPEYNGMQSISAITAGASQVVDTARQTVTLAAGTAGSTFRLTFSGQQTGAIAFDETPATVQTALAALTSIAGIANVNVTGPAGGPYVVVFRGTFLGTNPVAAMTVATVGTVTGTVATNFVCRNVATSSRFQYRILGAPATPSTGAGSYKVVTATNDFSAPTVLFLFDRVPARTAP